MQSEDFLFPILFFYVHEILEEISKFKYPWNIISIAESIQKVVTCAKKKIIGYTNRINFSVL